MIAAAVALASSILAAAIVSTRLGWMSDSACANFWPPPKRQFLAAAARRRGEGNAVPLRLDALGALFFFFWQDRSGTSAVVPTPPLRTLRGAIAANASALRGGEGGLRRAHLHSCTLC